MLQLLTVGRISVDLYADAPGAGFTGPQRFEKSIGGTATNVAVAAARLGHPSAVWTKVGADPFGDYVVAKLTEFGVDTSFVGRDPVLRTPLAFAAMTPPEDPELLFYRQPHAPDMQLAVGEVDDVTLTEVPVLWVAGSAMAEEPRTHGGHDGARHARPAASHRARPRLPRPALAGRGDRGSGHRGGGRGGNRGRRQPGRMPGRRGHRRPGRGCGRTAGAWRGGGDRQARRRRRARRHPRRAQHRRPPAGCEVVCGLGAGDAFGGALVHGLLAGWEPQRTVEYANAAGAIVAGRLLCADAMPTDAEVLGLMRTPTL